MYLGKLHLPLFFPLQIIQPLKFLTHQWTTSSVSPGFVHPLRPTCRNFLLLSSLWRPSGELLWQLLKVMRNLEKQLKSGLGSKREIQVTKSSPRPNTQLKRQHFTARLATDGMTHVHTHMLTPAKPSGTVSATAWRRPKPPEAQQSCQNKPLSGQIAPVPRPAPRPCCQRQLRLRQAFPLSSPLQYVSVIVLLILEGNCSLLGNGEAEN